MARAETTYNRLSWFTRRGCENNHYVKFFEEVSDRDSGCIRRRLRRLPPREQARIRQLADHFVRDPALRRNEKLRNGAARTIVALLPETFSSVTELLSDSKSRLWHEVHFIILAGLDRKALRKNDQIRVLKLIQSYIREAKSNAGYAAWKAGHMLGDNWRSEETMKMLEELLFSAIYPSGRKSALHGIKHALIQASPAQSRHLFSLIQRIASEDRSAAVRLAARLALRGTQCGPSVDSLSDKRG